MIRIGMLSFAHMHAYSYAECLGQIAQAELVGVADQDPERGQEAANIFDTRYYESPDVLLTEELDGVIITAENSRHLELVEIAAGQVPYILCEKPIADTLPAGQAVIEVCAQRGTKLQIAFPVRFSPPIQRLKQILEDNELGRVYAVRTTNHGSMPGGWFTKQALSGGGAVIDHTVHVIDLLRWFWNTEITEVYAEVGYELLHPGLGIDDAGMLSFKMANDAFGTLDTSWSRPESYPTWGDVTIEVIGEQGIIEADAFGQQIQVYSDAAGKGNWIHWGSNADLGLIQDFVECIEQRREPSITGNDGLRALEVAIAAYQAAQLGRPITLPLAETDS
jgi:predicted dehydrogenase